MATEAARLKPRKPLIRIRKNRLDTNRPSHGRTWQGAVSYPAAILATDRDSDVSG
jgi:hypothetical protein